MKNIMQGDAYSIPIAIAGANGITVDATQVDAVEIMIGHNRKTFPGELTFSDGRWLFPITQEESFQLSSFAQPIQIRVKFNTGDVVGVDAGTVKITASNSKEVL